MPLTARSPRARIHRRYGRVAASCVVIAVAMLSVPAHAGAQRTQSQTGVSSNAADPFDVLRRVLPADVAARVIARITDARSHGLAADALLQRALKFAARGIAPADIERSVNEHADRMTDAKQALEHGRHQPPTNDEIAAGAEAIRQGVDGSAVSALAKSAPSGRSLAVPLYVIGSLTARGLPADQALARVEAKLAQHASDDDLETLSDKNGADGNRGNGLGADAAAHGRGLGVGNHGGGRPASVPGNGGATVPHPTPPGQNGGHSHP